MRKSEKIIFVFGVLVVGFLVSAMFVGQEAIGQAMSAAGNMLIPGTLTVNGASPIVLEGATKDAYEHTIAVADPTADRTFTLPNDDIAEHDVIVGTGAGTFGYTAISDNTILGRSGGAVQGLSASTVATLLTDLVPDSLFDAQTILAATTDNTPAAVTVAEARVVGRATGGNVGALTGAQVATIVTALTRPAAKAFGSVYFTDRPADATTLTINGRVYEIDKNSTPGAGDVIVNCNSAASLGDDIAAIVAAIDGDGSAVVDANDNNPSIFLIADTAGVAGNSITLAETFGDADVSAGTLKDGSDAATASIYAVRHALTAIEAAGAYMRFETGLATIVYASVEFQNDGVVTDASSYVVNDSVILVNDAATAWGDGDKLNVLAIGY